MKKCNNSYVNCSGDRISIVGEYDAKITYSVYNAEYL